MRYATWLTPRQFKIPPTAGKAASPRGLLRAGDRVASGPFGRPRTLSGTGPRLLGMGKRLWDGVAVALVTLFEADAEHPVDVEGTARHAARLVEAGVRAV